MRFSVTSAMVGLATLAVPALAGHSNSNRASHHDLALRVPGTLSKRFGGGQFTYYAAGLYVSPCQTHER
jgi:hypothetical protein